MSVYGERLFGQVHRTPGLFYVSTKFFHVNFLPLFPMRSYLVMDGSDDGEGFQGLPVPMSLRSVLAGYLRGWLGAIAIFTGIVAVFATTSLYIGVQGVGIVAVLAAGAAMFGILWFIFNTRTWWFLPIQVALLAVSLGVYYDVRTRVPDAALTPGAAPASAERRRHDASYIDSLLIANAAAVLYSLTRLMTPGSYRKALALGSQAGIPAEQVAAYFVTSPATGSDDRRSSSG